MMHLSDWQRFALAILLLVAIPVAIGLYGSDRVVHGLATKWERFALLTLCLLGFLVKAYWKVRTDVRFWSIYLVFTAIHFVGLGYFFWFGNGLPFPIFELACAAEIIGMGLVIYWVLGVGPTHVNLDV
jgi:hypothetical protein